MNQQQFHVLKVAFWAALGLTIIAMIGSITDKVIQTKNATRTESTQAAPIAVPADLSAPAK
jgi:heme exporter protein D